MTSQKADELLPLSYTGPNLWSKWFGAIACVLAFCGVVGLLLGPVNVWNWTPVLIAVATAIFALSPQRISLLPNEIEVVNFFISKQRITKDELVSAGLRTQDMKYQLSVALRDGTRLVLSPGNALPTHALQALNLFSQKYGLPEKSDPEGDSLDELREFLKSRAWSGNIAGPSGFTLNCLTLYQDLLTSEDDGVDDEDDDDEEESSGQSMDYSRGEIRVMKDGSDKRAEIAEVQATSFEPVWEVKREGKTLMVYHRGQNPQKIEYQFTGHTQLAWKSEDGITWRATILPENTDWIMHCTRMDNGVPKIVAVLAGNEYSLQAEGIDEDAWPWIRIALAAFWITYDLSSTGGD